MKRNATVLVIVILAVAALIYYGARLSRRPDAVAAAGANMKMGHTVGSQAPDFTLDSLDGKTMKLSDYRGKAVLVNFWATWCGPCRIEMPWIVELNTKYQPQGLQVLGVAMDDSGHDAIVKFAKDMGVNYPILQGKEEVGDEYGGVQFLPETFLVDRNGKIVKTLFGIHSESDFEDGIKLALGSPAAAPSANGGQTQ